MTTFPNGVASTPPDFFVANSGSVVGFCPRTTEAREWVDENVGAEPWMWLGGFLNVEARYAPGLAGEIEAAGFTLGDA